MVPPPRGDPATAAAERGPYIRQRLARVALPGGPIFTPEALTTLVRHTNGVPRDMNYLCANVLQAGFQAQQQPITPALVQEVVAASRGTAGQRGGGASPPWPASSWWGPSCGAPPSPPSRAPHTLPLRPRPRRRHRPRAYPPWGCSAGRHPLLRHRRPPPPPRTVRSHPRLRRGPSTPARWRRLRPRPWHLRPPCPRAPASRPAGRRSHPARRSPTLGGDSLAPPWSHGRAEDQRHRGAARPAPGAARLRLRAVAGLWASDLSPGEATGSLRALDGAKYLCDTRLPVCDLLGADHRPDRGRAAEHATGAQVWTAYAPVPYRASRPGDCCDAGVAVWDGPVSYRS